MKEYRVLVNFGFVGVEDEYFVEAENEEQAKEMALEEAVEELSVVEIEVV